MPSRKLEVFLSEAETYELYSVGNASSISFRVKVSVTGIVFYLMFLHFGSGCINIYIYMYIYIYVYIYMYIYTYDSQIVRHNSAIFFKLFIIHNSFDN